MVAGLVIVPAVSLITPAPKAEWVEEIFSCYRRTVTVAVTDSIGPRNTLEETGKTR